MRVYNNQTLEILSYTVGGAFSLSSSKEGFRKARKCEAEK